MTEEKLQGIIFDARYYKEKLIKANQRIGKYIKRINELEVKSCEKCEHSDNQMAREQFIEEFIDHICTAIKDSPTKSNYLEPEEVLEIVEYRLQWLFDHYTFIEKEQPCTNT